MDPADGRWAPDPYGRYELRWWDGESWTEHVTAAGTQSRDPLQAVPAAPVRPRRRGPLVAVVGAAAGLVLVGVAAAAFTGSPSAPATTDAARRAFADVPASSAARTSSSSPAAQRPSTRTSTTRTTSRTTTTSKATAPPTSRTTSPSTSRTTKQRTTTTKPRPTTTTPRPSTTKPRPAARRYANCTAMHADYPHGVGRPGAVDSTSGTPVTTFTVDRALYDANAGSDRDKDGIACEQR